MNALVDSVIAHSNEWIQFPTTNKEITEAKVFWQTKYKFLTAIGVVNCTHNGILKLTLHLDDNINREGQPTLNAQVSCDT